MKRTPITERDIYAHSERVHSDCENGSYRYSLYCFGNCELDSLTADDVHDIIACLQNALKANGEGRAA